MNRSSASRARLPRRRAAGLLGARLAGFLLLAALVPAQAAPGPAGADPGTSAVRRGEILYREGRLASGAPLRALRENHTLVQGATAACVNCHRRSGLGNVEGNYVVPPITAKYLTRSSAANTRDLDMPHVAGYHQGHVAYTPQTLARALRDGIAPDGRVLSGLMPRYELDNAALADLLGYLAQLGQGPFPGVTDSTLDFATIVTPDADPVERQAMLEVLQHFFATQSEVIAAETRALKSTHEIKYRVTRRWQLHVWELQGDAATWEAQLQNHFAAAPVFAVVSGLGRADWAPVHHFCESRHVPCLLPNVDLPLVHESDFYPVYYSRGVLLEADLMAAWARAAARPAAPRRWIQIARRGDIGGTAADALAANLAADGVDVQRRELPESGDTQQLRDALADLGPADTLVLWLRPQDLVQLPQVPPPAGLVLASGLMGGMESAPLPSAWRAVTHLSYPADLPKQRLARMNFPYGWFKVQHIPIVAERVQVDTYLSCVITAETLGHVLDSFVPDYLLERMEMMISRRLANAYFPRLGLAPGQRFASKGGYIVHLDDAGSPAALPATADPAQSRALPVLADSEWIVP